MEMPKVLVVDDDNDFRELLQEFLTDMGLAVTGAASVAEAMNVAHADTPDLILLDVMLPDGSGLDACRALKSSERLRHVPVLVMSARSGIEDKCRGYLAGAKKYITKPCDLSFIEESIRLALSWPKLFKQSDYDITGDTLNYCLFDEQQGA